MMSEDTRLQLAVLEVLSDVHPLLMPERAILAEVRLATVPEPSQADVGLCLGALERLGHVVGAHSRDARKWMISASGRARLADR
jgi:hypothetical protein